MVSQSKNTVYLTQVSTKMGAFSLAASDQGLIRTGLPFSKYEDFKTSLEKKYVVKEERNAILDQACLELEEFFTHKRKKFDVAFDIQEGTDFQRQVWQQLLKVPYGKTHSYKQIAIMMNNPGAVRAVGLANKANPIPIFIPCHRVIGASGKMVGYAGNDPGNLKFKADLLQFEKNKTNLLSLLPDLE